MIVFNFSRDNLFCVASYFNCTPLIVGKDSVTNIFDMSDVKYILKTLLIPVSDPNVLYLNLFTNVATDGNEISILLFVFVILISLSST